MPYPIIRIPTDDPGIREARTEALRTYIEQRLRQNYSETYPNLMFDVVVSRRSDYDEVKVFLTKTDLVSDAKVFLRKVEEELAAEGIPTYTYVRTWTGSAAERE